MRAIWAILHFLVAVLNCRKQNQFSFSLLPSQPSLLPISILFGQLLIPRNTFYQGLPVATLGWDSARSFSLFSCPPLQSFQSHLCGRLFAGAAPHLSLQLHSLETQPSGTDPGFSSPLIPASPDVFFVLLLPVFKTPSFHCTSTPRELHLVGWPGSP